MIRSPWRYPGGKARLCPTLLEQVPTDITSYWEPFVGGGALALAVMERHADRRRLKVVLNDGDPRVSAWWSLVTNTARHTEEFNDLLLLLETVPPTVTIFRRLQELGLEGGGGTLLFRAYAGILLNRCAYSGILSAGPIGGDNQTSKYTVDCRFNPGQLVRQHHEISKLASQHDVSTYRKDFKKLLAGARPKISPDTFMYVDPPYYKIGPRMYPAEFTLDDHEWLARFLTTPTPATPRRWLLSYDDHPWVRDTYGLAGCVIKSVETAYAGRSGNPDKMSTSELIITPPVTS